MAQISKQHEGALALFEEERGAIGRMLHPALADQQERLMEFALAAVRNPKLAECSADSLRQALHTSAKCGLMPDGVEGALVPRAGKAQFEPMYQGLVKAYLRSGRVTQVWADLILKGETYTVTAGDNPSIKHEPDITRDRDNWDDILCAYACARYPDGRTVHIIVPKAALERLRATALKISSSGPWSSHPAAMAWKTPLKRLRKLVPLEPELQHTLAVQEADEETHDIEGEVVRAPSSLAEAVGLPKEQPPITVQATPVEPMPEAWCLGVRVDELLATWDKWKGQPTNSGSPVLAPLTWEQLSQVDTKHVAVPVMEAMLQSAAQRQDKEGRVAEPFKRAAVAWDERRRRLIAAETAKAAEGTW